MKRLMLMMVLVLVATVAVAKQHDEKKAMAPDMIRQLDPLAGKWQCKGIAYATPWFPEHPTTGEVSQNWILDGKWLAYTYAEKKTEQNPMPFTATGFFGYDPEVKMLVVGGVDSTGGYSTGVSSGWVGDVLTFEGPWHIGGMTAKARDTFTKKGANEMTHMGELEYEGKWMKLGQETCTRK
ncbi:MAG: DUF1579 domain-containing protein [Acidobacteriota bacterium]|nr:DUF1579 domain-containing protein [Acidobacteriota bacterium]